MDLNSLVGLSFTLDLAGLLTPSPPGPSLTAAGTASAGMDGQPGANGQDGSVVAQQVEATASGQPGGNGQDGIAFTLVETASADPPATDTTDWNALAAEVEARHAETGLWW